MAALISGHSTYDLKVQKSDSSQTVYGDKNISEDTIVKVAAFISEHDDEDGSILTRMALSSLQQKPLTHAEIRLGIQLIKDHPTVVVVPNEINKNPRTGHTFLTRELTIGKNDERLVALIGRAGLDAAFRSSQRQETTILGVSTLSWETLQRYDRNFR